MWKQGIGGKGITVAVLDDGLDIGHEVFEGNIAEGLSVNYFSPDKSNPTPTHPGDFHGTAMAGIIAAAINGKGGVGVAPKVKVAGLKIFDQDRAVLLTDQQDALSRGAANGSIDISNNSWGAEIDGTVGGVYQDAVVRAATRYGADHGRYGKGIVDLFAAGNDCEGPTCALPGYGWTNFDLMRHPQLLAIPAIDANGRHPDYSSPGSNNLVSALANKGRSVLRTTDDPPGITTALPRVTTPSGTQIPLTGGYPNCGTQSNGYQCPTSDFGNVYRTSATMPLDEPASGAWKLCVADTGASGARQVVKHVALTVH